MCVTEKPPARKHKVLEFFLEQIKPWQITQWSAIVKHLDTRCVAIAKAIQQKEKTLKTGGNMAVGDQFQTPAKGKAQSVQDAPCNAVCGCIQGGEGSKDNVLGDRSFVEPKCCRAQWLSQPFRLICICKQQGGYAKMAICCGLRR